ncbi:flagellar hook-length control protein FliK [Brevundimonas sp. M20]|uniref:flagellar hook-length control protein FliK n=1 Tax=Brevundimonas sp. M20 TaxID=2591463 RepID=UPI001F0D065E|nr:flagellar hook-length control protein FliK [Brevundimonas sp. M20]
MSTASALLSLIAPSAPTTSQGSATADASAFEGLLASMLGAGATGDAGKGLLSSGAASLIQTGLALTTPSPALRSLLLMSGADLSVVADEASAPLVDGESGDAAATPAPTPAVATVADTDIAPAPVDAEPVQPTADAAAPNTPVIAPVITPPVVSAPVVSAAEPAVTGETSAPTPIAAAPEAIPAAAAPSEPVAPVVTAPTSTVETVVETVPAAQPTPAQAQTPAQPIAPVATTPLPVEKSKTSTTVDTGPQVRPDVKADVPETPEIRPTEPVEPNLKGAVAQPLTQPPETVNAVFATPQRRSVGGLAYGRRDDSAMIEVARSLTEGGLEADPVAPTPETLPPAPVVLDKTTARPLVQPPVSAAVPTGAPLEDDATASIGTAETLETAETPDLTDVVLPSVPEAEGKAADTSRPVEAPNLRALADRASRTLETNAAVDTGAPSTPVTTTPQAPTTLAQAPAVNTVAAPAASAIETAVSADASDEAAVSDAPVDAASPEAPPSAQTAHTTREALGSTLSRAAIDATAQIAAQILKKLEGRSTRFEMSLTPDELGRVDVKLEIDAEGRLAARLAFDNPAAATDLKGRVDELRRQLEQQGFQLSDDALEFTQRDSGSSAFDRGQDSRQGQDGSQSRAFSAASRLNTEADIVAQPPRWQSLSLAPTGVDMKV